MLEFESPLARLGLPEDADVRAVRVEYARRLKTARPDADPAAFQELRETYEHALAWVALRADGDDVEDALLPDSQPTTANAAVTAQPDFDFAAFYDGVIQQAGSRNPEGMRGWLHAQDALWSLEAKAQVAHHLIARLWDERPAMAPEAFDALALFFDEWRVDRGRDDHGVVALRDAVTRRWFGFPDAPVSASAPARSNPGGGTVPIWPLVMGLLALFHLLRACSSTM